MSLPRVIITVLPLLVSMPSVVFAVPVPLLRAVVVGLPDIMCSGPMVMIRRPPIVLLRTSEIMIVVRGAPIPLPLEESIVQGCNILCDASSFLYGAVFIACGSDFRA